MAGTCSTMRSRNPAGAICIGPAAQTHVRSETDDSGVPLERGGGLSSSSRRTSLGSLQAVLRKFYRSSEQI